MVHMSPPYLVLSVGICVVEAEYSNHLRVVSGSSDMQRGGVVVVESVGVCSVV